MQGKWCLSHLGLFFCMWLWIWVIRWGGIKSRSNIFPLKRQRHQRSWCREVKSKFRYTAVLPCSDDILPSIIIAMAGKVSQKGVPASESWCDSSSVLSNHVFNLLYCVKLTKWNKCKLLVFPTVFLMFMTLMWEPGMTEKSAVLAGYWNHEVRLFGMIVSAPQAEAQTHDAQTLKKANKFTKLLSHIC